MQSAFCRSWVFLGTGDSTPRAAWLFFPHHLPDRQSLPKGYSPPVSAADNQGQSGPSGEGPTCLLRRNHHVVRAVHAGCASAPGRRQAPV